MDNYRAWVDFNTRFLLPFLIILISNILICYKLYEGMRVRQTLASDNTESDKTKSVTILLVVTSIAFFILVTPFQVLFILYKITPFSKKYVTWVTANTYIPWAVSIGMHYLNNSINFLLYCLAGKSFRQQMVLAFRSTCTCLKRGSEKGSYGGFPSKATSMSTIS